MATFAQGAVDRPKSVSMPPSLRSCCGNRPTIHVGSTASIRADPAAALRRKIQRRFLDVGIGVGEALAVLLAFTGLGT